MKPVLRFCKLLISISCALALAQPTPQQIHQRQMAEERALQHDQEQREQQQHQAQIDQMRQIDRQQAEDARQQAEKARAQAIAAQENLHLQRLAEQAQAKAKSLAQNDSGTLLSVQQPQTAQPPASQPASQPASPASPTQQWSFRNMSTLDKAGLAALGVILVALACAAGLIPAKRIPYSRNPR